MRCRSCGCRIKGTSTVCPRCLALSKVEYKFKLESYVGGEQLYRVFRVIAWLSRIVLFFTLTFCTVFLANFSKMYHNGWLIWLCIGGFVVSAGLYKVRDYLEACVDYNVKRKEK